MNVLLPDALVLVPALLLILVSFFTSALTAALGIGGGLTMLALMAYVVPPMMLIPVHALVQLGSNVSRAHYQRNHIRWPVVLPFLIGAMLGAGLGALLAIQLPLHVLQIILALFILMITWASLPTIKSPGTSLIGAGGTLTTFASMLVGATGPLTALFLERLFEERRNFVATHATAMFFQHGFKIIAFVIVGFALFEWLAFIGAMIVSGYLGTRFGSKILEGMPERTFRRLFKWGLTLIALDLLRRGLVAV